MGLFSKKSSASATTTTVVAVYDGANLGTTTPATGANASGSVAHAFKSKFYGKKGKQKELPAAISNDDYHQHQYKPSLNHSKSQPAISHVDDVRASPARPRNITTTATATTKRPVSIHAPPALSQSDYHTTAVAYDPSSSSSLKAMSSGLLSPTKQHVSIAPTLPRKQTDAVTVNLAQRLNDLATANSKGLLSDVDYRLLRQDLFERMAGGSPLPTEAPIVPTASPSKRAGVATPTTPTSQFQVDPDVISARSNSIHSKRSVHSTSVVSFLRRNTSTSKQSSSKIQLDIIDASAQSPRSRNGRHSTQSSQSPIDSPTGYKKSRLSRIFSSSQTSLPVSESGRTSNEGSELGGGRPSLTRLRSTPSMRHMASPPSSYTHVGTASSSRVGHHTSQHSRSQTAHSNASFDLTMTLLDEDLADDSDKQLSSQEIRQVIRSVEAECRRLMDAFNGLEMSLLTKKQIPKLDEEIIDPDTSSWTLPARSPSIASGSIKSSRTHHGNHHSHRRDMDSLSIRSHGTTSSIYSTVASGTGGTTRRLRIHGGGESLNLGLNPSRTPSRAGSTGGATSIGYPLYPVHHPQNHIPPSVQSSPALPHLPMRKRSDSSLKSSGATSATSAPYPRTPNSVPEVRALPPVPGLPGPMRRKMSNASTTSIPGSIPPPPLPAALHPNDSLVNLASGVRILPPIPHSQTMSSTPPISRSANASATYLPLTVLEEGEPTTGDEEVLNIGSNPTTSDVSINKDAVSQVLPPLPTTHHEYSHLRSPSRATTRTNGTSDTGFTGLAAGMDVERKREEVLARYEERLEYLRAKLKGAELREKVMRR